VHVVIAESSRAVVNAKRQVKAAMGKNLADYTQIVEHFQTSGLETLAP
jgi:hypothetical protein